VGRKPFGKGVTVAENVLAWGVGGLNVDGSRIGTSGGTKDSDFIPGTNTAVNAFDASGRSGALMKGTTTPINQGRWPANVILDEVTAGLLDEQSGVSISRAGVHPATGRSGGIMGEKVARRKAGEPMGHNDSGGASRFFYVAKASKKDRNEGCEEFPEQTVSHMITGSGKPSGSVQERSADGQPNRFTASHQNHHPTVKSTKLMEYLITLVTPPNGVVLDPFMGSGSTGKAAIKLGFKFIGIEKEQEYFEIAQKRVL